MGECFSGAEEVSDDSLSLDQLEVLLRRGHFVGRGLPTAGRGFAEALLDSPLGVIPE